MFRGDVGSWVREAAMAAMPPSLVLLCLLDPEAVQVSADEQADLTQRVMQALLKQAAERLARLREVTKP